MFIIQWTGYGGNTAVDPTNILWDSTQDANGNTNSGALKIVANWTPGNQYVLWDRGPNNTFALNPLHYERGEPFNF